MKLLSLLLAPVSRIHSYLGHIQVSQQPQRVQLGERDLTLQVKPKVEHLKNTIKPTSMSLVEDIQNF